MRGRDEESLDAASRALLARARLEFAPLVPLLSQLAHAPDALAGVAPLLESVLDRGRMPRTTKELAVLAVAQTRGSATVRDAFAESLTSRGLDPAIVDDFVKKGESSRLPDRTQRLIAFVRGGTTDLRRDGIGDPELAELAAVAGLASLLVTLAATLDGERA